jgi:GNAT superfamily N-acetyltransferase
MTPIHAETPSISVLTAAECDLWNGSLADLLIDAVDSGASVGFLPPLGREEAEGYWRGVAAEVRGGDRVLLAAIDGAGVAGTVQLACESRANGRHRAEACKLFVHRRARRQGLARRLLAALEGAARERGITLLLMDTRKGGEAERLCESLGYTRWGEVPEYARSANGELHTTVFFYRRL